MSSFSSSVTATTSLLPEIERQEDSDSDWMDRILAIQMSQMIHLYWMGLFLCFAAILGAVFVKLADYKYESDQVGVVDFWKVSLWALYGVCLVVAFRRIQKARHDDERRSFLVPGSNNDCDGDGTSRRISELV